MGDHSLIRTRLILVWVGLVVLAALGVVSALARVLAITDVGAPVTAARLAAARKTFPDYAEEIPKIEERFADSPRVTFIHVTTGAAFLTLGLLQFSARIRKRHLPFHRWSGGFLVGLAVLSGVTGLWLGLVTPYSPTERLPVLGAGAMFLITPAMGIVAMRRGDFVRHREWMIRFFAVGVGIVVIRLIGPLMIWGLNPMPFAEIIGWNFWAGWLLSVAVAELWIRATRMKPGVQVSPVPLRG